MDIYKLLVWMLLTDVADGADHMIVVDDYHGLVLDICSMLYMPCISFNAKVIKRPNL